MEMLLLPKGCYLKAAVRSVPDACTSTPLSLGGCIAPLGPHCWTSVPNRKKLSPSFCCLNSSSMAKDFLGTTTKCLVWRPAEVDAAYQSLEPSSGAFLDYWMETLPKNTNSIWLIQKGLWVTHARSRPATMKRRQLVFQQVTKATKNLPWKRQMRHRGRCQSRMLEAKEFGLKLSLCRSVCSTLWFLIESSCDFKRKAEPPNLKPQILF